MTDNYWTRLNGSRLNRRRFITRTGFLTAGVAAAGTVGCGSGDDTASTRGSTTAAGTTPGQATTTPAIKRGGTLIMARSSNLAFTDQQRSSGGNDPVFNRLYSETLLHREGGKIVAYMAQAYEQPDLSTITLKLRPDLKFGDGTPLNAAAVAYSIQRAKDEKLAARDRAAALLVEKVEQPDEFTAVLKLSRPNGLFLDAFTTANLMVSPTAVEKLGADGFNRTPVGAGPYTVNQIVQDGDTVFTKNPNWPIKDANGGALPYLDKIINKIIPQPEARTAALISGEIDEVTVELSAAKQVQSMSNLKLIESPSAGYQMVEFITNKPPTDNEALRKAINYALNRQELNQQLAFGLGKPALECLSGDSWVADPSLLSYSYDAAKAREFLSQAGYPDGLEIKLATYAREQAEAIQAQLAKVKIKAVVDNLELAVYQDKFRAKAEYPMGTAGSATESGELYQYFLQRYGSAGRFSPGRPSNPGWDAEIAKLETMATQAERKGQYQKMLRMSYDQAYRAFTISTPVFFGVTSRVRGVVPLEGNGTNADLRLAWLA